MYNVKNISKDPRKITLKYREIIVGPGESYQTSIPLQSNNVWEVKLIEEQIEQTTISAPAMDSKFLRKRGKK